MKKIVICSLIILTAIGSLIYVNASGTAKPAQVIHLYEYKAKVIDVHDGDTITCQVDLGFHVTLTEKFRLLGINAPELSTKEGKRIAKILQDKLLDQEIYIRSSKGGMEQEKYGRWLAIVIFDNTNINQWMIDNKYAVEYMIE